MLNQNLIKSFVGMEKQAMPKWKYMQLAKRITGKSGVSGPEQYILESYFSPSQLRKLHKSIGQLESSNGPSRVVNGFEDTHAIPTPTFDIDKTGIDSFGWVYPYDRSYSKTVASMRHVDPRTGESYFSLPRNIGDSRYKVPVTGNPVVDRTNLEHMAQHEVLKGDGNLMVPPNFTHDASRANAAYSPDRNSIIAPYKTEAESLFRDGKFKNSVDSRMDINSLYDSIIEHEAGHGNLARMFPIDSSKLARATYAGTIRAMGKNNLEFVPDELKAYNALLEMTNNFTHSQPGSKLSQIADHFDATLAKPGEVFGNRSWEEGLSENLRTRLKAALKQGLINYEGIVPRTVSKNKLNLDIKDLRTPAVPSLSSSQLKLVRTYPAAARSIGGRNKRGIPRDRFNHARAIISDFKDLPADVADEVNRLIQKRNIPKAQRIIQNILQSI